MFVFVRRSVKSLTEFQFVTLSSPHTHTHILLHIPVICRYTGLFLVFFFLIERGNKYSHFGWGYLLAWPLFLCLQFFELISHSYGGTHICRLVDSRFDIYDLNIKEVLARDEKTEFRIGKGVL